jgi:two-component system chemotaxis response regulator CheB
MNEHLDIETRIALGDQALEAGVMQLGTPSPYTCPECHGVLLEVTTDGVLRFRCHTGHAYTVNSLLAEVNGSIEETLWSAMRVIEEKVLLLRHTADRLHDHAEHTALEQIQEQAREAEQQVELVRLAVLRHEQRMKLAVGAEAADGNSPSGGMARSMRGAAPQTDEQRRNV